MNSVTVRLIGSALPAHGVALQVELEIAVLHRRVGRGPGGAVIDGRAAEEHLHARQQLAHRERLAEVVVGADLQAENAVELFVARGEKDDGHGLGHAADAPAELEAVHLRHHDVEDDQAGKLVLKRTPGLEPGRVLLDRISLAAQRKGHGLPNVVFIVDDRDDAVGWTHCVAVVVGGIGEGPQPRRHGTPLDLPTFAGSPAREHVDQHAPLRAGVPPCAPATRAWAVATLPARRQRSDEWQRFHDASARGSFARHENDGAHRLPALVQRSQHVLRLLLVTVADDHGDRRRDE